MAYPNRFGALVLCALLIWTGSASNSLPAAEPASRAPSSTAPREAVSTEAPVELFAAIDQGMVAVRFIPRSAREASLLVTNKSPRPVSVRLPASFVGVPVLAQFQNGNQNNPFADLFQGPPQQSRSSRSASQGLGSGSDQVLFNIAPEKVARVKVDCVCLDHGHPDPSPKIPYQLQKCETYVKGPEVAELLKSLADKRVSREAVQAAAWHLNSGLSWQELTKLRSGERRLVGVDPAMFTRGQLESAHRLVETASKAAAAAEPTGMGSPTSASTSSGG
jgi:hypothetical protein